MKTKYGNAYCKGDYYIIKGGKYHNKTLHRLIYEDHHKCTILPNHVVHHKNHDKNDNNIDNLELMTIPAHNTHHFTKEDHPKYRKDLPTQTISHEYFDKGFTLSQLADKYNCSVKAIHSRIKQY